MKNIYKGTLLMAAFFFVSCNVNKDSCKKVKETAFISIEKTPCFGSCPIYTFNIQGSRNATLNARRFMDSIGVFTSQLSNDSLCSVFAKAKECEWKSYDSEYLGNYSDLPSTIIRYSPHAKDTFTVRYENGKAPKELILLVQQLDLQREQLVWQRVKVTE